MAPISDDRDRSFEKALARHFRAVATESSRSSRRRTQFLSVLRTTWRSKERLAFRCSSPADRHFGAGPHRPALSPRDCLSGWPCAKASRYKSRKSARMLLPLRSYRRQRRPWPRVKRGAPTRSKARGQGPKRRLSAAFCNRRSIRAAQEDWREFHQGRLWRVVHKLRKIW